MHTTPEELERRAKMLSEYHARAQDLYGDVKLWFGAGVQGDLRNRKNYVGAVAQMLVRMLRREAEDAAFWAKRAKEGRDDLENLGSLYWTRDGLMMHVVDSGTGFVHRYKLDPPGGPDMIHTSRYVGTHTTEEARKDIRENDPFKVV